MSGHSMFARTKLVETTIEPDLLDVRLERDEQTDTAYWPCLASGPGWPSSGLVREQNCTSGQIMYPAVSQPSNYLPGITINLVIADEGGWSTLPVVNAFAILRVYGGTAGAIVKIHGDLFATNCGSSFDIRTPRFRIRSGRFEAGETPMSNRLFHCSS